MQVWICWVTFINSLKPSCLGVIYSGQTKLSLYIIYEKKPCGRATISGIITYLRSRRFEAYSVRSVTQNFLGDDFKDAFGNLVSIWIHETPKNNGRSTWVIFPFLTFLEINENFSFTGTHQRDSDSSVLRWGSQKRALWTELWVGVKNPKLVREHSFNVNIQFC